MNCTGCSKRHVGKGWICWSGNKKSIGACNNGNPQKGRILYNAKGKTKKDGE